MAYYEVHVTLSDRYASVGVPAEAVMTAVIICPAIKVLAAVALVLVAVEFTATAFRPVTLTPLIWIAAVNVPFLVYELTLLIVPLYGASIINHTVSLLTIAPQTHCANIRTLGCVGPVGPVRPMGPVGPIGPVGPPDGPVGPIGPTIVESAPVAPVGPVGPVGPPDGPVGPVGPVGPALASTYCFVATPSAVVGSPVTVISPVDRVTTKGELI